MGTNRELSKDVVFHSAASSVGTGTVAGVTGFSTIGIQVSGTWAGVLRFEATVDGENWQKLRCFNPATGLRHTETDADAGDANTGGTGVSIWVAPCAGLSGVRANLARLDFGTVTVTARITTAPTGELNEFIERANVSVGGQAEIRLEEDLLESMLTELKKTNLHLAMMTDTFIEEGDLEV